MYFQSKWCRKSGQVCLNSKKPSLATIMSCVKRQKCKIYSLTKKCISCIQESFTAEIQKILLVKQKLMQNKNKNYKMKIANKQGTKMHVSRIRSVAFCLIATRGRSPIILTFTLHRLLHVTLDCVSHHPLHWLHTAVTNLSHTHTHTI